MKIRTFEHWPGKPEPILPLKIRRPLFTLAAELLRHETADPAQIHYGMCRAIYTACHQLHGDFGERGNSAQRLAEYMFRRDPRNPHTSLLLWMGRCFQVSANTALRNFNRRTYALLLLATLPSDCIP